MTAHIATDWTEDTISVYCVECYPNIDRGVFATWPLCKTGTDTAEHYRDAHNDAKHPVFKPAVLVGNLGNGYHDFNGHTPHGVSAEDFTESHNGAEEVTETQAKEAISILADRIKTLQAKANARDLDKAREQIRCLTIDVKSANKRVWEAVETIESQETLITEMRQTIQELMETPDPMPLCKNLEGHRYVPLEERFVFCTFCGHSIHYKIK